MPFRIETLRIVTIAMVLVGGTLILTRSTDTARPPLADASPQPCQIGSGQDFSGQPLTGANFDGQDLSCANFSNATLVDATFRSATLQYVDLSNANLDRAVFERADLDR